MNKTTTPTRWWDLPSAGLLLVALITAASRLEATQWTEFLDLPRVLCVIGFLFGLALGYSIFSPRIVRFLGLIYGLFFIPWELGRTLGPGIPWPDRLQILDARLGVIIRQLIARETVQDSLLFLVLMAILFWFLGISAGYTLTRHAHPWRAILPAGLTLFVIHSFDPVITQRAWYLAVYLFFALVFVARLAYLHNQAKWKESRVALPPNLGLDFIRFTLFATAIIVLLAWTAPALARSMPPAERVYQRIRQPWNDFRDNFDNAFASLRATVGVVSDYYSSSLLLGRGNRLTDQPVILVTPQEELPDGARFYWRARTYDTYSNGLWRSTGMRTEAFDPRTDDFPVEAEQGRQVIRFEMLAQSSSITLLTPQQPLWVSLPARAVVADNSDGSQDLSTFRADPSVQAGELYVSEASVSVATIAEMRAAGTDYPDWVKGRYLQLPDTVTQRTRELAHQITAGAETPYDKAAAITRYLRGNITYKETVPVQPANQDAVDWFLFDLKEGFCNYYASAEVVLLRSLGIPARWSVGYAEGEYLEDGSYLVRQRDAHAWPEVYFPNLGWVEFEPTASQPLLVRLEGDSQNPGGEDASATNGAKRNFGPDEQPGLLRERDMEQGFGTGTVGAIGQAAARNWPYTVASLLISAVLLYLLWRSRKRVKMNYVPIAMERTMLRLGFRPPKFLRHWAERARLPALERAYLEINAALARLSKRPNPADTPSERTHNLILTLPGSEPPAKRLIKEYQLGIFSAQTANTDEAQQAGKEIRALSYRALVRGWLNKLLAKIQKQPVSRRRPYQHVPYPGD